jgi:PAS domain S-box-containing protein
MIEKAMKEGSNFFEWTHKRYKGEDFPATVLLSRVELKGRKFLQATVRDISKEKKAQEEIKESEEKYRALISNIPAIVMNVDQNGKIMFINYTLPGFTIEKTIGKTIYDFIPPEYHDKAKETIKQVFKTGKASIYETIGAGPKGEMKYYSTIVGPTEQEKKVVSVVLISSDITERKKAEEKIKTSEARYRSYIEATKQLGWTTDAKGLVTEDILTWRAYTGQSFEKIKNWGWVKAIHPDDAKHTAEVWKEAVKTKSIYEAEYRIRGKDGKYKWFFTRGIPVFKEDGSIREWVGTCIDISERIKVEEEIKKARDELQSKVEELERFNRLAVGRELKMVELKNRIKELEEKSNKT